MPRAAPSTVSNMARGYLLVDDEREFLALAREILGGEGRVVAEARDPDEAERLLGKARPAVVIIDVHIGATSGFQLARRLLELAPQVRIVMVSSVDEPAYGDLSRSVGAVGFLPKKRLSPVALETLLSA